MDYHADIVWQINLYLFLLCSILALCVVFYAAAREFLDGRKSLRLDRIRKKIQSLPIAGTGKTDLENLACTEKITTFEFFELLKDGTNSISDEAAKTLERYFTDTVDIAKTIETAQKSGNKWRRIEALMCLGCIGGPVAVEILRAAVKNKDRDIAYFALLAIGKIKTREAARILLTLLADRSFNGNRVISLLEGFPSFVIEEAVAVLRHHDPLIRFWAVKLLMHFRPQYLSKEIETLSDDKSPEVRAAVCECLGKMRVRESSRSVRHMLHDRVWYVRRRAITALSRLVGAEGIPEIADFLSDENVMVRDGVKKAMAHNIVASLPFIEKGLRDGTLLMKKDCAEVMESSGYLKVLFSDLLSNDAQTRGQALLLLKGLLNSGAHLGMEGLLVVIGKDSSEKILQLIEGIDSAAGEHMRKKIEHLIEEI